jgi:hypothetical protein
LPPERYGEWHWTVSVVQGDSTVATTSIEWLFYFNPSGTKPDDGDDGGVKEPTPPKP